MTVDVSNNGDELLEQLNQRYRGQSVVVDSQRPELARMAGLLGWVVAINANGRALVQFEGADQGWHDIDPDFLTVVEKSATKPAEGAQSA
jgi:hypothetical protein